MTVRQRILAAAAATALFALTAGRVRAQANQSFSVRAENKLAIARNDETIGITWADVRARITEPVPARVRVECAGVETPSQTIDNDGDGKPDELIFQQSFFARETRTCTVEAAAPRVSVEPRVFILHDEPRDDIAWESDRIAFRIYGEGLKKTSSAMSSSGIDVWVKSVHALVVKKWYDKGHDAYHIDTGEGADFFDVGETLGNGGTAVWRKDTIYRADNFKAWKIIANGPIRAVFELKYDPWPAGGQTVSETKRISIDAGQNMYRAESVFRSDNGADIPYVVGVVKRPGMIGTMSKEHPWAWVTGWGRVSPKDGGHGKLGTAVLIPRDRVTDWKEVFKHYLAVSNARSGQPVVHYIGAGWTDSHDFRDVEDWWKFLDDFSERLASPIAVTLAAGGNRATR